MDIKILRQLDDKTKIQFGFMVGHGTADANFIFSSILSQSSVIYHIQKI